MPTFDERRLDVGYDFGPNQGSVSMGENEYGGVPVGYDVGWHGNALPWIPGPLAGSVDAGPFHAEGAVDPSAHLNYGVARNQDGDMTVGLDAQATSGHGEVDVGPVGVGVDGPSADVHASANDNHALVGAGASAVNADVHYDDGTRRGSVGAGVGVGADFGVHYDKDPKDGRRYFGVEGDLDIGPGIHVDAETKTPVEDLVDKTVPGQAADYVMDKVGLGDYAPAAVTKKADDWVQGLFGGYAD